MGTMTDPAPIPTQPQEAVAAGQTPNRPPASQGRGASHRRRHPLLSAFPLTVMTLATFLVVFALMMARLQAGADPALRASAPGALVAGSSGSPAITTRTSGASAGTGAGPTTSVATTEGSAAAIPAIVTRTSGVPDASGAGDD